MLGTETQSIYEITTSEMLQKRVMGAAKLLLKIRNNKLLTTNNIVLPEKDEDRLDFVTNVTHLIQEMLATSMTHLNAKPSLTASILLYSFGVMDGQEHTNQQVADKFELAKSNLATKMNIAFHKCYHQATKGSNNEFNGLQAKIGLPPLTAITRRK